MLADESWPIWDAELAKEETVTLVIQVNGKVRDRVEVSADITSDQATDMAMSSDKIQSWIDGQKVQRVIARPPNLVNVVVG
jgi:leucyl-tRNA synthetase